MNRVLLTVYFLLFLSIGAQAYSTEYSAQKYQKKYSHEQSTSELRTEYDVVVKKLDILLKDGGEACKNAGETFNTQEAERVGRNLYDMCESYRHGEIRKQIHKNNTRLRNYYTAQIHIAWFWRKLQI